ncbi:MAG TPA: molybdopterin cofactor-binding domain-containing protein [Xanthobacteraceae bacterium]|nr:molybdopterin cofactor-binding domain-containing protein [Xanthobacteraceae bacterium]
MTSADRLSRRSLLISAAASGGALLLGFALPQGGVAATESAEVNAWIVIGPDDSVVIRVSRTEMGQGVLTALPMLVAEELGCDWDKVRPELVAPEENLRRNRVWGDMSTNASRSVSASQLALRQAGAIAREMLIAAAAARWNVSAPECRAERGLITHSPSGRRLRFGEVAAAAASLPPPSSVKLKRPSEWTLIGTPRKHLDAREKLTGEPVYSIDIRLPGMLYAAIRQCPVFKGRLRSVDEAPVAGRKGIRKIVKLADAVAVVAESWWQAQQAIEALPVDWDFGGNQQVSSDTISDALDEGLSRPDGTGRHDGDVAAALAGATRRIEADYRIPFLAHATLEPQNCTAQVGADRVEIWAPTQDGETALATAADALGLPRDKVVVHRSMLGGGFGRRGAAQDFVRQAVLIAREIGAPVQLVWSREEDIGRSFYRPMALARLTAGLDAAGMPIAWQVTVAGLSILGSVIPEMNMMIDRNFLQNLLEDMPYRIPNYRVDYAVRRTHVPVGIWRSIYYSQNAFFKESFIDEMAHAGGHDPYSLRRRLLAGKPRHLAVLDAAARRAGWEQAPPPGVFRGIAINEACGSICAQVVEVSVDASIVSAGAVRVHRVVSAIDCGHVVNPLTVELQTQSAVVFALTAALYGEITIAAGAVEQSNFHDYQMLRMAEMPRVETVIVPRGGSQADDAPDDARSESWGGVGEPPVAPLAPALCNAVFAATGHRLRSLPLKNHQLRAQTAR